MRFATRMMCVASEPVMNEVYDPAVSGLTVLLFEHLFSCTPDREIQRFTPCEKFLSHPRYLTPSHAAFKCSFLTFVV